MSECINCGSITTHILCYDCLLAVNAYLRTRIAELEEDVSSENKWAKEYMDKMLEAREELEKRRAEFTTMCDRLITAEARIADLRKENDQLRKAAIDMARLATKHPFFVSYGTKLREMAEDIIKEYGKEKK